MIWVWSIVILASLLIEVVTVGNLVSIWFCIGAVLSLVLALFDVSNVIQILTFAVVSIMLMLCLRPLASRYLRGNITATNADALIGRRVTLTKGISANGYGQTKIRDVTWNTISFDGSPIPEGTTVSILAIDGTKLIVRSVD